MMNVGTGHLYEVADAIVADDDLLVKVYVNDCERYLAELEPIALGIMKAGRKGR